MRARCSRAALGVFLAELARLAPSGQTGVATGGALFFVYFAVVAGPLVMSTVVVVAGGYGPVFVLVALLSALAALGFSRSGR